MLKIDSHSENGIKKIISFILASGIIKYWGITSTKMQSLYFENYKASLKKIKEDLRKWKNRLNIVKLVILTKLIYRFSIISIRFPSDFSAKIDNLILKFMRN